METRKEASSPLLVIDSRLAGDDVNSGISRFIVGLSKALTEELAQLHAKSVNANLPAPPRLLFVSKHEPPRWIVEIVSKHPHLATFWSGGPGAFAKDLEKPIYAWSTFALNQVNALTGGNFFWLAPGNFDRPLLFLKSKKRQLIPRVIQVIHDTIPFQYPDSHGLMFRWQFKFFVKRSLSRLPHVFTVSDHSASMLQKLSSKRAQPIRVLGCGIDEVFGAKSRIQASERTKARENFLCLLDPALRKPENQGFLQRLVSMRWIVGVGRSQKYKRWELAQNVVAECNRRLNEGALLIRITASREEIAALAQAEARTIGDGVLLPGSSILAWPSLPDEQLAELYRISDCLIHTSLAEGFGFPPAEAALSGLPVIFAAGTAVENHFKPGSLPETFWKRVDSNNPEEWVDAILSVLRSDQKLEKFLKELEHVQKTRDFMARFASRPFHWRESARLVLDALV